MAENSHLIPPAHLPAKQQLFYIYYLQTFHVAKSALRAGFSKTTAYKKAFSWVGKSRQKCQKSYRPLWDAIHEARAAEIERVALSEDWLLTKWMEIAGFSIRDIIDPETGALVPLNKLPPEAAAGIEGVKLMKEETKRRGEDTETKTGVLDIKTIPASARIKALEFLSKYKRVDPTWNAIKDGSGQAGNGTSEKKVIKQVLNQVAGKTRGLPKPVYEMSGSYGLEER